MKYKASQNFNNTTQNIKMNVHLLKKRKFDCFKCFTFKGRNSRLDLNGVRWKFRIMWVIINALSGAGCLDISDEILLLK